MALKNGRPNEFTLIDRYFRPLVSDPGAFGLADDAAAVRPKAGEEIVLKVDTVAEGVHFLADDPPEAIAAKALRVNLSDLAGKGAVPFGYLLALSLGANWTEEWVAGFARGLAADQKTYGLSLLGGDTTRASGGTTISITAIGTLPIGAMVRRSGAHVGDRVFVSGTIGDAALGLLLRQGKIETRLPNEGMTHLLHRYVWPEPRLALGPALRRYASAAMDVSDGLVGDFGHICAASGVTGVIDAGAVPLSDPARALLASNPKLIGTVLGGGDDYEILATIPESGVALFAREAAAARVPVTEIGRVTAGTGSPVVEDGKGGALALAATSFDHFRAG